MPLCGRAAIRWRSGAAAAPRREFLHFDDLADAVVFLVKTWSDAEPINIGTGTDVTIAELARLIADVVGFTGQFIFDDSNQSRMGPRASFSTFPNWPRSAGARASTSKWEYARLTSSTESSAPPTLTTTLTRPGALPNCRTSAVRAGEHPDFPRKTAGNSKRADGRAVVDDDHLVIEGVLQEPSRRHGQSTEEAVHEILRNAVRNEPQKNRVSRQVRDRRARRAGDVAICLVALV